ncbi:MAG: hypothetical protein DCF32_14990 [Leptolyngbya sp.]|nr:MAG: hypothetical protein DCF32_14990 [Leptolyngbya sp.]
MPGSKAMTMPALAALPVPPIPSRLAGLHQGQRPACPRAMTEFKPGDRVQLPDEPPARANGKPRQRFGTVQTPPFHFEGNYLVLEDGTTLALWKSADILRTPDQKALYL